MQSNEPGVDVNDARPADYWEQRYAETDRVWSGRVNAVLADIAHGLEPGSALDLGCGEGADSIWLAGRGWRATGVDISTTAIERARAAAREAGLDEPHTRFIALDFAELPLEERYDLVTASFLHSPVELSRTEVLRQAADRVSVGGHLLIISHAEFPPWAKTAHGHEHRFLSPSGELDELALNPVVWQTVLAETRTREAIGPDGEAATLDDAVLLLRRTR